MHNPNELDKRPIKEYYNNVPEIWPVDDKWHSHTYSTIKQYIENFKREYQIKNRAMKVLNAGSGGTDYGLGDKQIHIDIAFNRIKHFKNSIEGSIEQIALSDNTIDICVCVGSVINYCDAAASIGEFSRVLKNGGLLLLEFERSASFQYLFTKAFNKNAFIVTTFNSGIEDKIWVYSEKYIFNLLQISSLKVIDHERFHIMSPVAYKVLKDENKAAFFSKYDQYFNKLPMVKNYSSNIILTCRKV